jgi:hypothetical protein
MDLKKALIAAALIGITVFYITGCTSSGNSTITSIPAVTVKPEATTATGTNTSILNDGKTNPQHPDISTPAIPSDNGTRPMGGEPGQKPAMPEINWAAVAEKLGVTEDVLKEAAADISQGMPDFAAIAVKLGVTEEVLKEALGFSSNALPPTDGPQGQLPQGNPPQNNAGSK